MNKDRTELLRRAEALLPRIVEWRRSLHRWPELGYREERTAAYIADVLTSFDVEVTAGVAKTGVVGLLRGAGSGPTVALRAELDALPMQEATGFPFASENPGIMHACGHDGHMASVLGACALLAERREGLAGNVKFIFQPAEEMLGGGEALCEAGVLNDPDVDGIFALHLWPWLEKGTIGFARGVMMAAFDEFKIEVLGRSSHGASPHRGVDAIVVAARVVDALQTIVSREIDPQDPVVVTIGQIHGGTATNIVADRVEIAGSVRSFDAEIRASLSGRIERIAASVAEAHGATSRLTWRDGYPALINHAEAAERYFRSAQRVMGDQASVWLDRPSMASEDFAYYLQRVPGAFAFLGVQEGADTPGLHTPDFHFDERVLASAAATLACVALDTLEGSS